MPRPDWRSWIPAALLLGGAILTRFIDTQRQVPLALPLDSLPMVLAERTGVPKDMTEAEQRAAGMTSYALRYYEDSSTVAPFSVYVGYYDQQTQGKTIHSPKNCLPGSGWEALQQTTTSVPTTDGPVVVNRYLLKRGTDKALVYYWYQGRGRVAASEYRVKWELLRDAALRGRSEEALVRIVVFVNQRTSEADAAEWATRVASQLIPAVYRVLPA